MELLDIVRRQFAPAPWSEGDNIPWYDPAFSRRMLQEHLSQEHDAASRRFAIVDRHVAWIHNRLLAGRPTRILDLACGPGLYASRLARLGHECVGIDYAPASIAYAQETAQRDKLLCTYRHEDIRTADYGQGYGLAMLIYGEFNVFSPAAADAILSGVNRALQPGGLLLLEPHPYAVIQRTGEQPATWYSAESGLFSDRPHLYLEERHWDGASETCTTRYYIVDAATAEVTRYAGSMQAYSDEQYRSLLAGHGFGEIEFFPALAAAPDEPQSDLIAIVARKAQAV